MKPRNFSLAFWVILFFAPVINAENPGVDPIQREGFTWEKKKFSFGAGIFSGIGIESFQNPPGTYEIHMNLAQINIRYWPVSNLQISLNSSFDINTGWEPNTPSASRHYYDTSIPGKFIPDFYLPILLNVGYRKSHENLHWFIEGGGGVVSFAYPVFNLSGGAEWLVFKSYSLGFKVMTGITIGNFVNPSEISSFAYLSLTANFVL